MRANRTTLETLLELQRLDRVVRSGYALRGVPEPESVAEHTFHLAMLVWTLAADEPDIDRARAVELALLHDLAEVRTGDLPRPAAAYLPAGAKAQAEQQVASDLLAPLGDEPLNRLAEYQTGETIEARFVRRCDKFQVLLKIAVYEGAGARGLDEFWDLLPAFENDAFASIRDLASALATRRTKGCGSQSA